MPSHQSFSDSHSRWTDQIHCNRDHLIVSERASCHCTKCEHITFLIHRQHNQTHQSRLYITQSEEVDDCWFWVNELWSWAGQKANKLYQSKKTDIHLHSTMCQVWSEEDYLWLTKSKNTPCATSVEFKQLCARHLYKRGGWWHWWWFEAYQCQWYVKWTCHSIEQQQHVWDLRW